jgi:endo-1,4-beta-xylanase
VLRKDGSAKPAYDRLDHLINTAWRTRGNFTSDADGVVRIPAAFEGRYRIRAGSAKEVGLHRRGEPLNAKITLAKP